MGLGETHAPSEVKLYPRFTRGFCYNQGMKKTALFLSIAVACLVLIGIGFWAGNRKGAYSGAAAAEEKLKPIVERIYPKPAEEIRRASGAIVKILGATLTLSMDDPEDYIPHTDGTPRRQITRYATVLASTKIVRVDLTKRDARGNPQVTALKLSDLNAGDTVAISTDQNIRTAQLFDATQIELLK